MTFPTAFRGHVLPRNYRWFEDGAAAPAAPVSLAGQGSLRYNDTTRAFQASINGGAYTNLAFATDIGLVGGNSGSGSVAFGTTVFLLANGNETTEANRQFIATRPGVLRNLFAQATTNILDDETVLTLRINGIIPINAVTVTIPALSIAQVSDLANARPVLAGDLISLGVDTTASGAGIIDGIRYGYQLASA